MSWLKVDGNLMFVFLYQFKQVLFIELDWSNEGSCIFFPLSFQLVGVQLFQKGINFLLNLLSFGVFFPVLK